MMRVSETIVLPCIFRVPPCVCVSGKNKICVLPNDGSLGGVLVLCSVKYIVYMSLCV